MRLAVGVEFEASLQQEQARIGTEGMPCRERVDVAPAQRLVKALQVARRGKISLPGLVDARQCVKVIRHPAAVFRHQLGDEVRGRSGIAPTRSLQADSAPGPPGTRTLP